MDRLIAVTSECSEVILSSKHRVEWSTFNNIIAFANENRSSHVRRSVSGDTPSVDRRQVVFARVSERFALSFWKFALGQYYCGVMYSSRLSSVSRFAAGFLVRSFSANAFGSWQKSSIGAAASAIAQKQNVKKRVLRRKTVVEGADQRQGVSINASRTRLVYLANVDHCSELVNYRTGL